jgi:signal transduction histidine kinase
MVGSSVVAAITDGHLEQILDNLIANALESVQREGWVRLEISHTSSRAMLRLVDNGTGMTADQRARAFGRFVTDRGSRGGTGLGLAIVGRLVAADGGVARLDETPGGGLTVEVGFQLVIGHGRGAKALQAP